MIMDRFLLVKSLAFLLAGQTLSLSADNTDRIVGDTRLKIDDIKSYSVSENSDVINYDWLSPVGCNFVDGQGTASVTMKATYIAQDSPLQLIRTYSDGHKDTLSLDVTFHRYIKSFVDHSIKPGQSVEIDGKTYTEADIYYEPAGGEEGFEQVVAHRVTVDLEGAEYRSMTEPYLQTATSNSIWISWKTDFTNSPVVVFGESESNMSEEVVGNSEKLSETYFWNSVKLTGLSPNTMYYYKIKSGDKESAVYRFRTMPEKGSKTPMRILLMGDHQLKKRSGYEWLMKAAGRKIEEKYGNLEENINMIMNVGDQVDNGTLDQYELINYYKSKQMSPFLPIMTAVGNHDTYSDPGMARYAAHNHFEELEYKGIKSGTENYYAYQAGRILFVVLSTEHTGDAQKNWVRQVVDAAKNDDSVDFIISVNHRPIQAEQYIGDISPWVRNEIIPILSETPKHVLNYGGHHHLYHRGQIAEYPLYHIINGAASYDQMWGMSSEKDYDDVQKTIDYWGYQILEFDFDKKEMKAECYAIGNKALVTDNILIDSFHRIFGKAAPEKPELEDVEEEIELPYTFRSSEYKTTTDEKLNTVQYQFSTTPEFTTISLNVVRDVENLYGSTKSPLYLPIDLNHNVDITEYTLPGMGLSNGTYYVRVRYRDENMEWSDWSDSKTFKVIGSVVSEPVISMEKNVYDLNSEIEISYSNAPVGKDAWIGVYRKSEKPGTGAGTTVSYRWAYTSASAGSVKFKIDETNEYYAVLFADGGYDEITERIPFYFGPVPELSIEKDTYEEGEDIKVKFSNAPALKDDWIGIYRMGEVPGTADLSDSWDYTSQSTEGEMVLDKDLPEGYYFVNYFTRGGYFEPRERIMFAIGDSISDVSLDKMEYAESEDITIYYHEAPGTPKDWVGVYEAGKVPGVDDLDGFFYTYGSIDGKVVINAGDLKPGKYFCSLYINDSWDEVSGRKNFVVKGCRTDNASGVVTAYGSWNREEMTALDLQNATVLDLRNASFANDIVIGKNGNPNCLVYVNENDEVTDELQNVVFVGENGAHAANISLTDGHDFFSVLDFEADAVSYRRSFESGWSVFSLPFATVEEAASEDIVEVLSKIEDDNMFFVRTKEILSGTPYLMYAEEAGERVFSANGAKVSASVMEDGAFVANFRELSGSALGEVYMFEHADGKSSFIPAAGVGSIAAFRGYVKNGGEFEMYNVIHDVLSVGNNESDGFRIYVSEGALYIVSGNEGLLTVYGIDGVKMSDLHVEAGLNIFHNFEKGFYIIGGRKIVIN